MSGFKKLPRNCQDMDKVFLLDMILIGIFSRVAVLVNVPRNVLHMHLLVLSCAVLDVRVHCSSCSFGYIPLNVSTQHVQGFADRALSWEEMALQCRIQFPGHDLVERHFLELSDVDKVPCKDFLVPLGIVKIGNDLVFPWGLKKPVDNSTLGHMESSEPTLLTETVAALNLTSSKWKLVGRKHPFTCALCQRSHRSRVNTSVIPRPVHRNGFVYYGIVEEARPSNESQHLTRASINDDIINILCKRLGVERSDIYINMTVKNVRNNTELNLRIRSWKFLNTSEFVSYNISGNYKLVDFYDAAFCRPSKAEGLIWPHSIQGAVITKNLEHHVVAARECTFRRRPDGDWDAEWDAVIFWDFSRQAKCYLDEIKAVAKHYTELAAKPPVNKDYNSLLDQLVKHVQTVHYVNNSELAIERNKIINGVMSAVGHFIRSPAFQSQTANHYYADGLMSNFRDADPLIGVTATSVPGREKGDFGVVRRSELGRVATDLMAVASESMYTRRAAMALGLVNNYHKVIFPSPVKQLMESSGHYLSNALVMIVSFADDDQISLSDDYYLEVKIRNVVANNETARYLRNFAVWAIDSNEKLTETCLLVDTDKADTYKCRKMVRSLAKRLVLGVYVANRGFSYDDALNDTLKAAKLISRYANIQVDSTILNIICDITNYLAGLKFGYEVNAFLSRSIMLSNLKEIFSVVDLGSQGTVRATSDRRVAFLVDDLKQQHHMVGFSKNKSESGESELAVEPIPKGINILSRRTSEVDVVLSPALVSAYSRLAFSVFNDYDDLFPEDSLAGQVYRKVSTVQIILVSDTINTHDVKNELYYFEIFFNGTAVDAEGQTGSGRRRRCVLWNPEGGANDRWSTSACFKLKSTRGSKQVFRCNAFHYGLTRAKKPVADGVYFTFEVNEFNDFLADNVIFLVWLAVECVISLSSLLSIFSTAIVIRKWREDLGHQILLHMTLALAINILFGFINNFLILDTESVACIAVGVTRHYSYMAMFFWMFVLSALQLKRLLSVLGWRSAPNLQLKVAAFAWGMPLIVILVLFLSVQDAYRSVVKDRGFCYPEGLGFEIFVQGPAGLILALNVIIFVVILARIYACFGWGDTANLQRHANVRTVQLRRLKTAFFIFFLFGLSWTFHFLAEEGVIRNKFIFEYLFLMTACLHVFMLAVFFIYLDEGTRKEWKMILEDLAPIRMLREWMGQ